MREFADHSGQGRFENRLGGTGSGYNLAVGMVLVVFLVLAVVVIVIVIIPGRGRPHFPKARFLFGRGRGIAFWIEL